MEYDIIHIQYIEGTTSTTENDHDSGRVKMEINAHRRDRIDRTVTITDPLKKEDRSMLEDYFEESVRPSKSWRMSDQEWQCSERTLDDYRNSLWANLGFANPEAGWTPPFIPGAVGCKIHIIEGEGSADGQHTIHRLAWELLEYHRLNTPHENYTISVTRKISFRTPRVDPHESLLVIQNDPKKKKTFKILLVVARDLSLDDVPPGIAQRSLLGIKRQLKQGRLLVEVVRPGSFQELCDHLERRYKQDGLRYNVVHFDMHGELISSERYSYSIDSRGLRLKLCKNAGLIYIVSSGNKISALLFGHSSNEPSLEGKDGESVARTLAKYQIDSVVFNACFSASCIHGKMGNLSRELLRSIPNVSAMWHYVHHLTADLYVENFYRALLVDCMPFAQAAYKARRVLREGLQRWKGSKRTFQDAFVCVNYQRAYVGDDTSLSPVFSQQQQQRLAPQRSIGITIKPPTDDEPRASLAGDSSLEDSNSSLCSSKTVSSAHSHGRLYDRIREIGRKAKPSLGLLDSPSPTSGTGAPSRRPTTPNSPSAASGASNEPTQYAPNSVALLILDLERNLAMKNILYVRAPIDRDRRGAMESTVDSMVEIWLETNKIDKAKYYDCKSFIRTDDPRPVLRRPERKTRDKEGCWPPPLDDTLHIIKGVDSVVAGHHRKDEVEKALENIDNFLVRFYKSGHDKRRHYYVFLGAKNEGWWKHISSGREWSRQAGWWECRILQDKK